MNGVCGGSSDGGSVGDSGGHLGSFKPGVQMNSVGGTTGVSVGGHRGSVEPGVQTIGASVGRTGGCGHLGSVDPG